MTNESTNANELEAKPETLDALLNFLAGKEGAPTESAEINTLVRLRNTAPHAVAAGLLDAATQDLINTAMPTIGALLWQGPAMKTADVTENKSIARTFDEAIAEIPEGEELPESYTPTVLEATRELGQLIDKLIKRVLITHSSDLVNRKAYHDLIQGHALLCRGLGGLSLVEDDWVNPDEYEAPAELAELVADED